MLVRIANIDEPVPGYRLIEPLGRGGFGEVWKAEAPGGVLKALKMVHGTMACALDADRVQTELKSLELVKSVRHPYILGLDRYDVVFGQLLIVMELADRTLWDRFTECRKQGLVGIPRSELLHYMGEAAEALDLMNLKYDLQHSDIKPQNLFLVHNHVKIADFGLVKDLEGMKAAVASGVSPLYAAPETFEGFVSRFSDQYSLAILYQEMLTGERPFDGSNGRQLLMQHLQMPPNLSMLPAVDRPAVGRALSKDPAERYPSCSAFVVALRGNAPGQGRSKLVLPSGEPVRRTSGSWPNVQPASAAPKRLTGVGAAAAPVRKPALVPAKSAVALTLGATTGAFAFQCPGCSCVGQVPLEYRGRPVRCRECRLVAPAEPMVGLPGVSTETPVPALDSKSTVEDTDVPTAVLIEVECPVCGNMGRIPETFRDRRVKCRRCGCVHR